MRPDKWAWGVWRNATTVQWGDIALLVRALGQISKRTVSRVEKVLRLQRVQKIVAKNVKKAKSS
jgi:hypothetical protein